MRLIQVLGKTPPDRLRGRLVEPTRCACERYSSLPVHTLCARGREHASKALTQLFQVAFAVRNCDGSRSSRCPSCTYGSSPGNWRTRLRRRRHQPEDDPPREDCAPEFTIPVVASPEVCRSCTCCAAESKHGAACTRGSNPRCPSRCRRRTRHCRWQRDSSSMFSPGFAGDPHATRTSVMERMAIG